MQGKDKLHGVSCAVEGKKKILNTCLCQTDVFPVFEKARIRNLASA